MSKLASPQSVRALLERHGLFADKRFGQNFLVDPNILSVIGRLASLSSGDVVLEIGPGLGVLTTFLADRVRLVHAIEIDRSLEPQLQKAIALRDNVELRFDDGVLQIGI